MSRKVTCDGRLPRSRPARSKPTHLSALVCATLLGVALAMAGCARTSLFIDAQGKPLPGSIASMETAEIGGIEQSLWFPGIDASMPALLFLHGGPGASEAALFRHYDADIEKHFLVVYWDQRGAGRSFHADIPKQSMTIAQFERDLDQVVDLVRWRFHKRKVVLLAHSWGTVLGTLYAVHHPDKVSAHIA